jgi:uncharacterized protein (DUF4415 family)
MEQAHRVRVPKQEGVAEDATPQKEAPHPKDRGARDPAREKAVDRVKVPVGVRAEAKVLDKAKVSGPN